MLATSKFKVFEYDVCDSVSSKVFENDVKSLKYDQDVSDY